MSIRLRLALGFLTILALFATNEGIQLYSARLRARTMDALSGALKRQALMASIQQRVTNLQQLMSVMSQLEDAAVDSGAIKLDIEEAGTQIEELAALSEPVGRDAVERLQQTYAKLAPAWRNFFESLGVDEAKAVAGQLEAEKYGGEVLDKLLPDMRKRHDDGAAEARQSFEDTSRRTEAWSLSIFGFSMVIAVVVAYLIARYLTASLSELSLGAALIGANDLEHRITVRSADEIGTVAGAFNSMASNLLHSREELTAANTELTARNEEVEHERQVSQSLLLNILPEQVASELAANGSFAPRYYEDVTVLFTDFVGFTLSTEKLAADELVNVLNGYFTAFDQIVSRYGLEKMKTIGDAYFCAGGLPVRSPSHPVDAALAAFEMIHEVQQRTLPDGSQWKVRIGLNTGPVVAGVVGIRKFAFDVWGDTVNLGSRMETGGAPNRINVSEPVYRRAKDFFSFESRGKILTKEKKELETYFINGVQPVLLAGASEGPIPPAFAQRYRTYFGKEPPAFPPFLLTEPAGAQRA